LRKQFAAQGMSPEDIELELTIRDHYSANISLCARPLESGLAGRGGGERREKIVDRPALKHVKENVGTTLNKALESDEDANPDALQDVLKGINFNRKIGSARWMMIPWPTLCRTSRKSTQGQRF